MESMRKGKAGWLLLVLLVLPGASPCVASARTVLDLSGAWQYQKAARLDYPPGDSWQVTTVPGYLRGNRYEHAWYRRTFKLSRLGGESRVKLRFGGAKFDSQVWINGLFVGRYLNGYEPFELDITRAIRIGSENELIVGLTDWTATLAAPVDFSTLAPEEYLPYHARDALLAPIGGWYELYGLWQPVQVVVVPVISIADVFVLPSVRQQQLTARITVRNDGTSAETVTLKNRVLEGDATALSFADRTVTIAAGAAREIDVTVPWSDPHLWSHLDPHLYDLQTTLDFGDFEDQVTTRFGFREFWCDGDKFYLNGICINLLATSAGPPPSMLSRTQIQKVLSDVKAGNNVAMRLHSQPWDETWYDVADEVGLLIVQESAVYGGSFSYRLADPVFWANYAQHLAAAMRRDRNHPSIVLWSLENELLHVGGQRAYAGTQQELAELGRQVKALDPTRPITYEGDLDPAGAADVIGLHYPHEFPEYALWPQAAFWMDEPIARDWTPDGLWQWLRDKPLYIGEFLWVPLTSASIFTILYGDDVYRDPEQYRYLAQGWTWQMQIAAYRSYGVNGICPWTMFEGTGDELELNPDRNHLYQSQKAAYHPNAVFVQSCNTRFFVGDTPSRWLTVCNDTMTPGDFLLKWRSDIRQPWTTRAFHLDPAARQEEQVTFSVPAQPGPFTLDIELDNGTTPVFSKPLAYAAHPRPALSLPLGIRLGVYDPQRDTADLLRQQGIEFVVVRDLSAAAYDALDLLLIGRDALVVDSVPEVGPRMLVSRWADFARQGHWIIVLEQSVYPRWMPLVLSLEEVPANFAFPDPRHPLTKGLAAEDLRWWAGDERVVSKAIRTPSRGNYRVPVSVGSAQGLEYAGLLEVALGQGGLLCSQLLLRTRFDAEPMAGVLWQRLFDYCTSSYGHVQLTTSGLLAETGAPGATRLSQLGLAGQPLSGKLATSDLQAQPVLVIAGRDAAWREATRNVARLAAYVEQGGRLLLHRPSAAFLAAARPALFPDLDWTDTTLGLVLRRDRPDTAVAPANHDLYWIEQAGSSHQREVLSTNVARRTYRHTRFTPTSYVTLHAENMPIHTIGHAVTGGWNLVANGYIAQNVGFAAAGSYLVNVQARGTPLGGVYPLMSLRLDGRTQDSVYVNDGNWRSYVLSADVTAGTHALALSFDNDAYQPPEDRNLYIGEIQYGLDAETSGFDLLTRPGAIAQVRRGRGLILLDEIAWDTEEQNRVKADRVACALLTGLGAALQVRPSLRIEAEEMKNVDVGAYGSGAGIVSLGSNGRIETSVRFTAPGDYTFEVFASGTPVANVAPILELRIDGATRQAFSVESRSMYPYATTLSVSGGLHTLALAFTNDYWAPPEDRNVAVDRLTISPAGN